MRCQTCDYRLWNLTSRICPECGSPFRPSDFEFAINSVKYLCPHCGQQYYGTDGKGHLDPMSFDCVNCGQHIHMDDMTLLPADHVSEDQTAPDRCPWLDRGKLGFFKAMLAMIGRGMVSPVRLIRSVPMTSPLVSAWGFLALMLGLTLVIGSLPLVIFMLFIEPEAAIGTLFFFVVSAFVQLLVVVIWGLVIQFLLRVTGGCAHTIGRTYQALCYSSGPMALTAIPCLGPYLSFFWSIWWMVSAILMIQDSQRVHGGRASLAVLTLPALMVMSVVGLYAWLIYSLGNGGFGPMPPPNQITTNTTAEVQGMTDALHDFADDRGRWPEHAVELLVDEHCRPGEFATSQFQTDFEMLPLGDRLLGAYDASTPEEKAELIEQTVESLPEDTIAHRYGDYVFTCHGIDRETGNAELWILIFSPDPDWSSYSGQGLIVEAWSGVIVGKLDGSIERIGSGVIKTRFDTQNRLRRKQGLEPLPLPTNIKNEEPWTPDSEVDPSIDSWPSIQLEVTTEAEEDNSESADSVEVIISPSP